MDSAEHTALLLARAAAFRRQLERARATASPAHPLRSLIAREYAALAAELDEVDDDLEFLNFTDGLTT